MEQTAVEWLGNELSKYEIHNPISLSNWKILKQLLNQAKQMEKEQMIEFGNKMQIVKDIDSDGNIEFAFNPEQFYNENYSKGEK
ncbi:hypothetical protein [Flavobacterium filum]|uniref:hypothetical protein n=1 Tax=Flavobacterium filum TaxID=370974 RepID=UPI0023F57F59|nr:hypothetical protein [Flavobacterium filum]